MNIDFNDVSAASGTPVRGKRAALLLFDDYCDLDIIINKSIQNNDITIIKDFTIKSISLNLLKKEGN